MGLYFGKVIKQSLERKLISGVKLTLGGSPESTPVPWSSDRLS